MINKRGLRSAECGVKAPKTGCGLNSAALVLVMLLSAGSAVRAQPADDVAARVEKHYQSVNDLFAKISQKNFLKSVGKTQKFAGTLSVRKPGKLRLEYTNDQIVVIDGKEVWFYSKKNEQAIRKTFADFEAANVPVAFLLGAGNIREDFDVLPAGERPGAIELAPKKAGAAMKKLRIEADAEGRILVLTVYDRNGNTSEVAFSEARENAGLDDSLFRFKVPKGTEVIEQ